MIELAAAAWKVGPHAAVLRLLAEGVSLPEERSTPEAIATYVRHHPQYRNKLRDFWRRCREYLLQPQSKYLARLRAALRLVSTMSPERWAAGPGNLMGAYPCREVEKVFHGRVNVAADRTFPNIREWSEVLVFKYEDVPDRPSGFYMIGRQGTSADVVFRIPHRLHPNGQRPRPYEEAGLHGLWAVEESHGEFGKYVVAVNSPLLSMRLQLRRFHGAGRPLPLVAFYDGPRALTHVAWDCLDRYTPVLWGWRLTASLLFQAVVSDGHLSLAPVQDMRTRTIDHYVRHDDPADIVRRAIRHSKPWRDALRQWCEDASGGDIADLAADLEHYPVNRDQLTGLHERLDDAMNVRRAPRKVRFGRATIIETDGKWWVESKAGRRLLMNAVLRIDGTTVKDVCNQRGQVYLKDVVCYKGRLIYKGTEIPFEVPISRFEDRGARAVLSDILAKATGATLVVNSMGANQSLDKIALMFQPPPDQ
jgi:hypothetical protein